MTAPDVDPFAEDPIQRDQWGRPKIIPVKRGKPDLKAKLVGYTRASTFANAIVDAGGLATWRLWHLALGLGRNPDLAALASVYGPTVDDLSRSDQAELNEIIERAHDRSGGNVKADHGTVVHALTEPDPLGVVPDRMAADVASYLAACDGYGLQTVATEQFVVCDELQVAGTFDHLVQLTRDLTFPNGVTVPAGTIVVLDKKTGKLHFDSQCIQLAVYANAKTYDPETGVRGDLGDLGTSFKYGIIAHIPKGEGRTDLYLIDLRVGWVAAKLAGKVREHRTRKDIGVPFPTLEPSEPATDALSESVACEDAVLAARVVSIEPAATPEDEEAAALAVIRDTFGDNTRVVLSILDKLAQATTRDELSAVWREHRVEWNDDPANTVALRARAAELEAA